MGFYEILILGARIAQLVFSLIVLGCAGYVASASTYYNGAGYVRFSIPQVNFNIFVAVWSILVVGFQILVPRFSAKLAHKFVILGLDALTALFWFAGFIALAVLASPYDDDYYNGNNYLRTLKAAAAFGAFAWVSFMITTVLSGINIFRGNTGSAKHAHNPEIGHSVA